LERTRAVFASQLEAMQKEADFTNKQLILLQNQNTILMEWLTRACIDKASAISNLREELQHTLQQRSKIQLGVEDLQAQVATLQLRKNHLEQQLVRSRVETLDET
jgi:hypothetical protein